MIQPRVRRLIEQWCPPELRRRVLRLIDEDCTAAAFHIDESFVELLERIQMAVLRGSNWDPDCVHERIQRDSVDFRDLLMARGFGHDTQAHIRWFQRAMETGEINEMPTGRS